MEVIEKTRALQERADAIRAGGGRIALVPTMGALHEGHLALVRAARERADVVIVSVFVNPTQFGPSEDFGAYPRDLEGDVRACDAAGANLVFAPPVSELYPEGAQTRVLVDALAKPLCGASRPVHFAGVATVVTKLLAAAKPHLALFGLKDFQQVAVVRRLVRDLCLDVEIVGVPTVREPDGLAMSSRNQFLDAETRPQATVLVRALRAVEAAVAAGERSREVLLATARSEIEKAPSAELDYAELRDPESLEAVSDRLIGDTLLALAVRFPVGGFEKRVRLIDNTVLTFADLEDPPVILTLLKSKIHRATVTEANIEYEGSISIDPDLLEAADILPYESVDVWDCTNGQRLRTYAIEGDRGSGEICVNGAAAHRVKPGDLVIIASWAQMGDEEARRHEAIRVFVDGQNRQRE